MKAAGGRALEPAGRSLVPWPLFAAGMGLLGFLVLPLLALAGALPGAELAELGSSSTRDALSLSLVAATVATTADAALGVPLGLWLAGTRSRFRHAVTAAVLLPLAVPPVVGGLELVLLLGPGGWLGSRLAWLGLAPLDTATGTVLAQMFVAAPFVVISARAAFAGVDPEVTDAARSLGCGPWRAVLRALVPAARRGIAAGLVLGWLRCVGEFGATAVVAYHPYTLPTLTYVNLSGEGLKTALPAGALLAAVGSVLAVLLLGFDNRRAGRPPGAVRRPSPPVAEAPRLEWLVPPRDVGPLRVRVAGRLGDFRLAAAFGCPAGVVALLGASGAGKSLTLRAMAGLLRPGSGLVAVGGRVLLDTSKGVDLPPEHRSFGYVAQRGGLFQHLDVESNIAFGLWRLPAGERRRRVDELLAATGLGELRHSRPATLSGGERQRVALARALAPQPQALLLDEPFASLDTAARQTLRALVGDFHRRSGIPVVMVTHDRDDVFALADHLVVLEAGSVVQAGTVAEVLDRPASAHVARLLGFANVLPVRSAAPAAGGGWTAETGWGEFLVSAPAAPCATWELAVPEDAVRLASEGHPAVILDSRPGVFGRRLRLRPASGGAELLGVVDEEAPGAAGEVGGRVNVRVEGARCRLIPAAASGADHPADPSAF